MLFIHRHVFFFLVDEFCCSSTRQTNAIIDNSFLKGAGLSWQFLDSIDLLWNKSSILRYSKQSKFNARIWLFSSLNDSLILNK